MKDDEDLTGFTSAGVYTEEEATRIRRACQEVLPLIQSRTSPFDDELIDWQPSRELVLGQWAPDWHLLPGADIHLSTLNYERGIPGRRYDAWRTPDSPPLWSWRNDG